MDEKGRGSATNQSAPSKILPSGGRRNRRGLRARFFAWLLSTGAEAEERHYDRVRRRVVGGLGGPGQTVVEIGPGAGPNAAHLAQSTRWICAEPNPHFHRHLRAAAAEHGLEVEIHEQVAEGLPLPDASADAVVATLVLCSVDDGAGVLREVLRVLKPGAPLAFIEHVGAAEGSRLRWWQEAVAPAWGFLADGCHPARDSGETIRAAGFGRVEMEQLRLPLGLIRPHVAGRAWKAGEATEP